MSYRKRGGERDPLTPKVFDVVGPLLLLVGVPVLLLILAFGSIATSRASCLGFGEVVGREAEYRHYGVMSFGCFVRSQDGKWIPKEALRDVVGG